MIFRIKEKFWAWGNDFAITDADGRLMYYVDGQAPQVKGEPDRYRRGEKVGSLDRCKTALTAVARVFATASITALREDRRRIPSNRDTV